MSTSELTAAICSATRGRYWPFTTTVRGQTAPDRKRGRWSPGRHSAVTAAGLAAQLLKWHFVLAEPTSNGLPIIPLLCRPFSAIFSFEDGS